MWRQSVWLPGASASSMGHPELAVSLNLRRAPYAPMPFRRLLRFMVTTSGVLAAQGRSPSRSRRVGGALRTAEDPAGGSVCAVQRGRRWRPGRRGRRRGGRRPRPGRGPRPAPPGVRCRGGGGSRVAGAWRRGLLMAPPWRLASVASKAGGATMRRVRMSARKPGAYRSTCAPTRSAMASCSRPSQTPVMSSSPASPRMRCGMWVHAQARDQTLEPGRGYPGRRRVAAPVTAEGGRTRSERT
jgi:hypothetical protein